MEYSVARTTDSRTWSAPWTDPLWRDVAAIRLTHFMGSRPKHFPVVQAKLLYDDVSVHVIFRVQDQFVVSRARCDQDSVCVDSCVEFFFSPDDEVDAGYFNLEMNCGGTILFHYMSEPRTGTKVISREHLSSIARVHSLPKLIECEMKEPIEWQVGYRLPTDMLSHYYPTVVRKPAPGVRWRANFFKCADESSHPHWLTWTQVDSPTPDFHRPNDFGTLNFV